MIAIRGAVRVDRNDRDVVFRETQRLLREIRGRNELAEDQVVSVFFTMTPDLNADFPAYAAREMGWTDTAMLGAQETAVPGALDRVVRVLIHAEASGPARHVYLGEAAAMRPDLADGGEPERPAPASGTEAPRYGSLLVVGLGLIGGSAALSLRRRGLFEEVLGHDVDAEAVERAWRVGAISERVGSLERALSWADVVLLAMPVDELLAWLERRGGRLERGTVVLDVGSTKTEVIRAMNRLPEGVEAVGAHPMAGSEESGMGAARPDLFYGARWALVETERTGGRAREVAEAMVDAVGGRPFWTGPSGHDRATAATSHLPYLLSAALTRHLRDREEDAPVRELMGPGAKDLSRLAGSDPTVMAGILATNWPAVRREVEDLLEELERLVAEMEERWSAADGEGSRARADRLRGLLSEIRADRRRLVAAEASGGKAEG